MALPFMPYCDGMPSNKRRLVYDVTFCMLHSSIEGYIKKAVKKGWHDALVAVMRQDMDNSRIECVVMCLLAHDTPQYRGALAAVLPHMRQVSFAVRGDVVGKLLARQDETLNDLVLRHTGAQGLAEGIRLQLRNGQAWQVGGIIDLCLRHGADIHYNNGSPMKWAVTANDTALMDHLVEQGFDLRLYRKDLERHLQDTTVPHTARVHMTALLARAAPPAPQPVAPVVAVVVDGGYLRSGDCVSRVDALPDGGSLTTVFNFATCQQILIAHVAGQTGQPSVVPFDAIPHDKALQDAARAYVQQGGAPQHVYAVTMGSSVRVPVMGKPVIALPKDGHS